MSQWKVLWCCDDGNRAKLCDVPWTVYDEEKSSVERGKAVISCKIMVVILSEASVLSKTVQDEIALAYVTGKPIFPVSRYSFEDINPHLNFALKLTIAKLNWMFFRDEEESKENAEVLIKSIQEVMPSVLESRAQGDDGDNFLKQEYNFSGHGQNKDAGESTHFWSNSFGESESVSYDQFQEQFLSTYGKDIKEDFGVDDSSWILELIHNDVFEKASDIALEAYQQFCGGVKNGVFIDRFYARLKEYAVGNLAMKQVFGMESTVRLAAVTNMGSFNTPAVIASLTDLLENEDPNIRAVALVALSRTGTKKEKVMKKMMKLMTDDDRLAREAAVLSLGKMKYTAAVEGITATWRNDPIKPVREAAERALGYIGGDATAQSMRMVHLLQDAIKDLKTVPNK